MGAPAVEDAAGGAAGTLLKSVARNSLLTSVKDFAMSLEKNSAEVLRFHANRASMLSTI